MSTPDPIQADITRLRSTADVGLAQVNATEAAIPEAKQKELAPLEAQQHQTFEDARAMQPPAPAQLPATPDKPLVDPKEYEKLSWGLIGMALIGGIASRGNWYAASSSLNGAMNGYLEGNQARADQEWTKYQADFDKAVKQHDDRQKDYLDTLNNKKLTLNQIATEISAKAAKYDDQYMRAEAQRKSYDGMLARAYNMDVQREKIQNDHEKIVNSWEEHKPPTPGTLPPGFSQEDIDYYARRARAGDSTWKTGLARTKAGAQIIAAVDARVPELSRAAGATPEADAVVIDQRHAISHALTDRTKFIAAANQFVSNFQKQADLVEKYIDPGAGGNFAALNKWIQGGRKAIGDPDVDRLDTAIRGLAREHQRIVTGVTSNAQLHQGAADTADELLNVDKTPASMRATMGVMREEAANALESGKQEVKSLQDQLQHLGGTPTEESPRAPGGSPADLQSAAQAELKRRLGGGT